MAKPGESPEPTLKLKVAFGDAPTAAGAPPGALPEGAQALLVPPPLLPRGTIVGRYVIEGPLGEGGMGVVYAAHDPELDRPVALKLLRPDSAQTPGGEGDSAARNRLVREAHAMAKLNHPNVVAIHDSGVYGDQVFLAVELVVGTTLKAWLKEAPRDWREILAVFLKAGRGVAAAHTAGLVHRDFKPENVLIGKRGEVKVADFGLARAAAERLDAPLESSGELPADFVRDQVLMTPVTRVGTISGTPAYMSPEQILGRGGDARTDEFSFCVAIYRSLYGEQPFQERLDPLGDNRIRPPPKGTHVPAWVRRALLRGLQIRPEDRYANLGDLLDALSDDPAVRRRRVLTVAAMAALLAGAVGATALLVLRERAAADPCHDPEGKLVGVWDEDVRLRVRAAFTATGAPDARSTAAYAEKAMDRASQSWAAAFRDACDATRLRHAQPEAALNLRLDCLIEQRFDLRAAADIMSRPDAKDLSSAIGAATTLPLPSECADARALSIIEQPTPERRPQVDHLRLELAKGRALTGAGRYRDAVEILKPLPDQARALDVPYPQVYPLMALAAAYHWLNDYEKAIDLYTRAEDLAAASHLDQLATQAAAAVAFDEAVLGRPKPDVDFWLNRAREDLRRAGLGGTAEYFLERAVEIAEHFRGHFATGAAHARRALELADRIYGSESMDSLRAVSNLAADLEPLGSYDEQMQLFRRAVAGTDAILGPRNQRALFPQLGLAEVLFDLGRSAEAETALDNLFARLGSEDRIQAAGGLAVRAAMQSTRGEIAEALQSAGRALDMAARLHLMSSPNWADVHRYSIEAYLRSGRPRVALDEYEKYLAHQDFAADSPGWVALLRLGGWAHLDAGQPEQALPILERALKLSEIHPFYAGWVPRLRWQLARALVETRGDRRRAEALAQAAHDELQQVVVGSDLLAEVDAWRGKTFKPR